MLFSVVIFFLGIIAGQLLFCRLRFLLPLRAKPSPNKPRISVIIPARNEAHNLPRLLRCLQTQTLRPHEIICVDDASTDETAAVATTAGTKVLRIREKPKAWMGKSYACHMGAAAANGSLFLFLDADVRLDTNALLRLYNTWQTHGPVVSVQPWHLSVRLYEQCCLFFNIIAAAALATPPVLGPPTDGLFGPIILMPAQLYRQCGGHEAIKSSVLDDISLGQSLSTLGIRPYCCQGGQDLRYRMYPNGCATMLEGWTKNFASGAVASRFWLWVFLVFWIAALLSAPLRLVGFLFFPFSTDFFLFVFLSYFVLCFQLQSLALKIGRFSPWLILFYPIALMVFMYIFFLSAFKKIFHLPVFWKGRDITKEI